MVNTPVVMEAVVIHLHENDGITIVMCAFNTYNYTCFCNKANGQFHENMKYRSKKRSEEKYK